MAVTENQRIVMETFAHLCGQVLTKIEAALGDKVQRESLKKIIEQDIYDARNNLLTTLEDKSKNWKE